MLTYRDYVRVASQSGGSEGGPAHVMTEREWNSLTPQQQWLEVNQLLILDPTDPRYEELHGRLGGEDGRPIFVQDPNVTDDFLTDRWFTDPSRVERGQNYLAYADDNRSPHFQAQDQFSKKEKIRFALMAAALLGGGAMATGGFGAGAAGTEGLVATIPENLAIGGSLEAGIPLVEMPEIIAAGGGMGGGAAGSGAGLAGLGEAAGGGMTATIPENLALSAGGGGSSIPLVDAPNIVQAGGGSSWMNALGGPGNIARGALGLASLGAASGGGGGGGSGSDDVNSLIEQMANVNRVDQTTPFGTRRWHQDPQTGRWSVVDALSEPEQANFEQVQGMNSDVTGLARSRLAEVLTRGPRPRYDRPLGT